MSSIAQTTRYIEHLPKDRYNACKLYSKGNNTIREVCRRYKISKASLMRWMNRFDGTRDSLISKSRKPKSAHPNSHTKQEIKKIYRVIKKNPSIGQLELYGILRDKLAYTRHPQSLFRFLRKQNMLLTKEHKVEKRKNQKYDTPKEIGVKMQLDVKFVPKLCNLLWNENRKKYYQYTIIDEASRERFIYAYEEFSAQNTVDFCKRSFIFFGYLPKTIQTDNGGEFTYNTRTMRIHPLKTLCDKLDIEHRTIRPYTPKHNGKVERSHRNDNNRFYKNLKFKNIDDLNFLMMKYLKRSNNIPSTALNYLSPNQKRKKLTDIQHFNKKILTK